MLTRGDRPRELEESVGSIIASGQPALVVGNGIEIDDDMPPGVTVCSFPTNLGVPGGRDAGVTASTWSIVGFLDDDARLQAGAAEEIAAAFRDDPQLGVVALRIVDEDGVSNRRHVPRPGGLDASESGRVATFLGGASAIRRRAYDDAGGFFVELFYGHEEVELSWRLIDRGWTIRYLADAVVFHPRTEISRHAEGWELTGRNRVLIARRSLPWPVAIVHVSTWLVLGAWRAPDRVHRRAYLRGWWSGWRRPVDRAPIRWSTVWQLIRLGRPPVI